MFLAVSFDERSFTGEQNAGDMLIRNPCYIDELENYFITSNTMISLEANDDVSGVAGTYYSINGEPFKEYLSSFSITGENGIYTIAYYSVDNSGNVEETKYLNVSLTNLKAESYITQGFCKKIDDFDVIFRKARMDGATGYKLIATNPGQMFYHIIIENTWSIPIENLVINIGLSDDFVLKGCRPIHVFMNRWCINRWYSIEDNIVQISHIKSGKRIHIVAHIEYGMKGTFLETVEDDWSIDYNFESSINADGILEGDYSTYYTITANQKCIGHYIRCSCFQFRFHSRYHHNRFKFCCGNYGTKSVKCFSTKLSYKWTY